MTKWLRHGDRLFNVSIIQSIDKNTTAGDIIKWGTTNCGNGVFLMCPSTLTLLSCDDDADINYLYEGLLDYLIYDSTGAAFDAVALDIYSEPIINTTELIEIGKRILNKG